MATSATLDGVQINGNDTHGMNAFDWGGTAIAQLLFTGDLRESEYDQFLADQRTSRQITYPFRITGSSVDVVYQTLSEIQKKLSAANRFKTVDFIVVPHGSGVPTTFKVVGGYIDTTGSHNGQFEVSGIHSYTATLYLECSPWAYGPKQSYGSQASPLRALNNGPDTFDITPISGSEGDVPADITVYLQAGPSIGIKSLLVGTTKGQVITPFSGANDWTLQPGTQLFTAAGSYEGNVAGCEIVTSGNMNDSWVYTLPAGWPNDRPFRAYLRVRDNSLGQQRFRLKLTCGQQIVYSDWAAAPTGAWPSGSLYFGFDMGIWFFPPAPLPSTITPTITITCQQQALAGSTNRVFYDMLILVPDDSFILAEPTTDANALALSGDTIQVDGGGVSNISQQGMAGPVTIGASLRARGPLRVMVVAATGLIHADSSATADWAPESPQWSAWATYTPRYVELAN